MALTPEEIADLQLLRAEVGEWARKERAKIQGDADALEAIQTGTTTLRGPLEVRLGTEVGADLERFFGSPALESLSAQSGTPPSGVGAGRSMVWSAERVESSELLAGVPPDREVPTEGPYPRSYLIQAPVPTLIRQADTRYTSLDGTRRRVTVTVPPLPVRVRPAALVCLHGYGDWESLKLKWLPYSIFLAENNFLVLYPDTRYLDTARAAEDVVAVARWIRARAPDISDVGVFSASAGNYGALDAVELYPTEFQAYASCGGALDQRNAGWHHREPENVGTVTAPTLLQVGGEDGLRITFSEILLRAFTRYNLSLVRTQRIYPGGRHGFQFLDTPAAQSQRQELVEFYHWQLRGGPAPGWWPA